MRALALWLLLAPFAVHSQTEAAPAAHSPLDAIAECSETAGLDVAGGSALDGVCPGLDEAVQDSGYGPFISPAQYEELTAASLADLHALIARYQRTLPQAAPAPDPQALPGILASLREAQQIEQPLTWWEKFRRWLRERLGGAEGQDSWLTRWLEQFNLDPSVARIVVLSCIVLVIVLALVVLINELRVAGVFRRGARRERGRNGETAQRERAPAWADLERLAPADRPSFVLRMLVAALVRSGRLRTERSLTHREITVRAEMDDDAQRACLARVAALAERVVYGGAVPDADADAVIAQGRELHARLSVKTP